MSSKSTLPPFMRAMTPAKFKALNKEEQRAYRQKSNAWLKEFDARIDAKNAESQKRLLLGFAELIQQDPGFEWEIVHNFLKRNDQLLIDRKCYDMYPAVGQAMADYELKKAGPAKATKSSKRAKKTS